FSCAGVGAAKFRSNHAFVSGLKTSSALIVRAYLRTYVCSPESKSPFTVWAVVTCPACGQENPDGFRLCGMCGAALVPAAATARLQSAAPVNGILVGEGTYRATRHVIDYREAEPVEAKGKSEPVKAWEAVAARARLGSDVEERLRTPLVGRERERDLLADALT